MSEIVSNGTMIGYKPQWRKDCGEWTDVPTTVTNAPGSIPESASYSSGVLRAIDLMRRTQAMAVAWRYAAESEAIGQDCEVRIRSFKVQFSIEATPNDQD